MATEATKVILVPGAWMGGWIWEPTVQALRTRGIDAESLTLHGLDSGTTRSAAAAIHLEDHVQQLIDRVTSYGPRNVVLVSHSYSATPAAIAADRLSNQLIGVMHIAGFLPINGRSLIDDWSDSAELREAERVDIDAEGGVWLPPERDMLDYEPDLTPHDRDYLANKFTPHPGRTVTDPARLARPIAGQPTTYVALSPDGDETAGWNEAPQLAKDAPNWRRKFLRSGHWPMLSDPQSLIDLIVEEVHCYEL